MTTRLRPLLLSAIAALTFAFVMAASAPANALPGSDFQGKPSFSAGSALGAFVWHDSDGIHIRFTSRLKKRTFAGSVCVKGKINDLKGVRLEKKHDTVNVGPKGHCVRFSFLTRTGIDGFDFRGAGDVTFDLHMNGAPIRPALIRVGAKAVHPGKAKFKLHRVRGPRGPRRR